jgi:hypothetical protein
VRREAGPDVLKLNRSHLWFACARRYIPGMTDQEYWTRKLQEAERELDATRKRTEVNEAATACTVPRRRLKALEAKRPRRPSRGSRSAGASS